MAGGLLFWLASSVIGAAPPTVAELFARLDLTRPGLEVVRAAVDAGDLPRAAEALKAYYRQRERPTYFGEGLGRPVLEAAADTDAAERVLRREYAFVGKPATLTHDIDWNANPHNDAEWPIELNRHMTWQTLAEAWWRTDDRRFLDDLTFQIDDWLTDNPRPERGGERFTWRTLECGLRLSYSWPYTFFRLVQADACPAELLCRMLASVAQQADHLIDYPKGGNWLVMERTGLLTTAILFPEFEEAEAWRNAAWATLLRELDAQVYPDGAQMELTPPYHRVALRSFVRALEIAELNNVPPPPEYVGKLERMYAYTMAILKPSGHIPMLNDSDHDDQRDVLLEGARRFGREDMRFVATAGADGTAPAFTSCWLPWAGQAILRSGWTADDVYLCFDAGPYGLGHQHEDKLSIDLWGYGEELLVDPGRYTYAGGKWRSYFVSTASHSTVLVDGHGQNRRRAPRDTWIAREPLPNRFEDGERYVFIEGRYDEGYEGGLEVVHVRRIVFDKLERWYAVGDTLLPAADAAGEHALTAQYQLAHPGAVLDPATGAVRWVGTRAGIAMVPLRPGAEVTLHEGEEDPPAGWVGWSLHQALKEPATLVRYTVRGALPLSFVTVLVPSRAGELDNRLAAAVHQLAASPELLARLTPEVP